MKTTNNSNQSLINMRTVKVVFLCVFLFFIAICIRVFTVAINPGITVNGMDLETFAKNRNTAHDILTANRGTIYDNHSNILAHNIIVYKLIAYLDPKRSQNTSEVYHVQNKALTASKLAPILDMEEARILSILNKKAYQVEFGIPGSSLTELKKEQIEKLNLSGLEFEPKYKRYYPNGPFLSYILGYARNENNNLIKGEMGLELYFDKDLGGRNGLLEYQRDRKGYKIANTKEYRKDPVDGKNIYLTIDTNVQLFLERSVKKQVTIHQPETMLMAVMEAKTGKLLGVASEPSFDPNIKNIKSYMNPLVSSQYEPGSTMKIFTYLSSIIKGNYNGNTTFMSGSKTVGPDKVNDWKPEGWGTLTYDQGFALSSNVGIANIVEKNLSRQELYDFYSKLGFGEITGFPLPKEEAGKINFKYPLEVMNAGFGQGMTVTPIQMLQAFTAVSNNGKILRPYIIDKIKDPNTNEIILQNKPEVLANVATEKHINQIKDLMSNVVNCGDPSICTGSNYAMPDLNIMGKTGTAQVAASNGKGYLKGDANTIKSFVGIFPKEDPKYVVYVVVKRPRSGYGTMLSDAFKEVVTDLLKYGDLNKKQTKSSTVQIGNYLNQDVNVVAKQLTDLGLKPVIIGTGVNVIGQSSKKGSGLLTGEKLILLTDGGNYVMPNISNWSYRDVVSLANVLNYKYKLAGSGYVYNQTPLVGAKLETQTVIRASLKPKM